jgi:hypothetical protein
MTIGKVCDVQIRRFVDEKKRRANGDAHGYIQITVVIDDTKCRSAAKPSGEVRRAMKLGM